MVVGRYDRTEVLIYTTSNETCTTRYEALKSIARFTDFDIKTALCYHGGICDHDVNAQFARLATRA